MKRADLEHIIRAAAQIASDDEIMVFGTPDTLLVSNEADVYPKNHPERWELIDGSIGELSMFHETFGYYAQGVEPGTAVLPDGWERRLVAIQNPNTRDATGWCLELHDLVLSKYVAGRDKDRRFARAAFEHGLLDSEVLLARLPDLPVEDWARERIREQIALDGSTAN